jgi:hypothetical protein
MGHDILCRQIRETVVAITPHRAAIGVSGNGGCRRVRVARHCPTPAGPGVGTVAKVAMPSW